MRRAGKVNKRHEVPSVDEILEWLKSLNPLKCYLTNQEVDQKDVEFDHVRSVSRGGSFDLSNIKPVSREANMMKADMTLKEYNSLMKLIRSWSKEGQRRFLSRLRMGRLPFRRKR